MQRSRLNTIIEKSKKITDNNKKSPFDKFKESLPKDISIGDSYRLESAWKAYGSPKNYKEALWEGMILPIEEGVYKLPSIGYNEETEEYEYLNKGKENETVNKDIRVWDNDVIPFVKELKQGGYVRTFNEEKDCWTYTKNIQKKEEPIDEFKKGGKVKIQMADGSGYIEIDELDADLKAGRKPIGKGKSGKNIYLNKDGKAVYAENTKENPEQTKWMLKGGKTENKEVDDVISLEDFINQKIQERTEAAIKKATTRKTGYKFKNKSWKNCVATATDNYGVPIVLRNSDLAADPKKYGFEELLFGDNTDTLPDGVLILDYNKPNDYTTPGHTIMLVGRTETGAPIYSYSSGSSDPSDMHNSTTNYFFDKWNDKVKPRAYRYIGTPAERAAWEEEYRAMYPEVEAFKQGGKKLVLGSEGYERIDNNSLQKTNLTLDLLKKIKENEEKGAKEIDTNLYNELSSMADECDYEADKMREELDEGERYHEFLQHLNYLRSIGIDPDLYEIWYNKFRGLNIDLSPKGYLLYHNIPIPQSFKQGGQMNVIPDGALHARKNNMELAKEGEVTHKGIPVVDNEGNQLAEVEKEEWTMTKELTEDVEKWYKKYFDEETSQKDKDELAIKCGKRIVKELLHNTDDRAGIIERMEAEL